MMSPRVQDALDGDMGFTSMREVLEELGHDGIAFKHKNGATEYVAFQPEQIKSAIGNTGDFDPANPDIMFSRTGTAEKRKGRDWLVDKGEYNSRRPQAKATLDGAIIDGADHLRNLGDSDVLFSRTASPLPSPLAIAKNALSID